MYNCDIVTTVRLVYMSITTQFCVYCGCGDNIKLYSQQISSTRYSIINCGNRAVHSVFRAYSSCITETSYPFTSICPCLLICGNYCCSLSLCKFNFFKFYIKVRSCSILCLAYFTQHNVLQDQTCHKWQDSLLL